MEYLMTYGWVLISILVIIALLISSGVFDTGKFINQECKITPDFPCLTPAGEQLGDVYKVRFNFTNALGYKINIQGIELTDINTGQTITNTDIDITGGELSPGDSVQIAGNFEGIAEGDLRTFYLTFEYFRVDGGSVYQRTVSGRIKTKIE